MPGDTVVVVGAGGREHALARRLAADPERPRVVVVPGNDGIAREFECVAAPADDASGLADACAALAPWLVVVGPEAPLAAGLADRLEGRNLAVFGPRAAAARLEASKWFAKQVMAEAGVPTAAAEFVHDTRAAARALDAQAPPWVLKADGLAAGKGVCVTSDRAEADAFARACLEGGRFGRAGEGLLVERFLAGEEMSVMAVCNGDDAVLLPAARDYKRAFDGDRGPNTGGMGAYAPAPLDAPTAARIRDAIVRPVLATLARRGTAYRGVLYCGLMLGAEGPRVVEFNVRFGDPEAQVVLPRTGGSVSALFAAAAAGRPLAPPPAIAGATVALAIVHDGYPEAVTDGATITQVADAAATPGAWLLFAAVRAAGADAFAVTGGRAAYVCAEGESIDAARDAAYAAATRLGGAGWRIRRDIATIGAAGGVAPA